MVLGKLAMGLAGGAILEEGGDLQVLLGGGAIIVLALVVSVMLSIQRLHDFDANGWRSVRVVVPFANLALYLVLLIMPGTQGPTDSGIHCLP